MTATYPRSVPILSIAGADSLRIATQKEINSIIKNKPKPLLGYPMIFEIAETIKEVLEEAAQSKAEGPDIISLEEERAIAEAEAARLAKLQEAEERRKKEQEDLEEQRMLGDMIKMEIKSRRDRQKESKRRNMPPDDELLLADRLNGHAEHFSFDQSIQINDEDGRPATFRTVSTLAKIRRGAAT